MEEAAKDPTFEEYELEEGKGWAESERAECQSINSVKSNAMPMLIFPYLF